MDRNVIIRVALLDVLVALRKESVDRNRLPSEVKDWGCVALRKESVDRNKSDRPRVTVPVVSLSARRAWIEMGNCNYNIPVLGSRSPQGERG